MQKIAHYDYYNDESILHNPVASGQWVVCLDDKRRTSMGNDTEERNHPQL